MHVLSTPPAFVLSQDQTLRECLPVIRLTPRERNAGRNSPDVHSVLAVFFKGTSTRSNRSGRGINISGVDFWHAVEFSRNGRFLCTHPFGLSSGRFPSVLRFRLYQIFPIRFPRCFPGSRFRVSLSGGSDSIRSFRALIPRQRGLSSRPLGRSDVPNLSGLSRRFPIGVEWGAESLRN